MYFRRNYEPESPRDYYRNAAFLLGYMSYVRSLRNEHGNSRPGYDPLLFFALGYLLAASDSDPVSRVINGMPPEGPGGTGQSESTKPFEVRYTKRTVFQGPLDTSILTDNYRPGRFFDR